jgi:hypothetical protein
MNVVFFWGFHEVSRSGLRFLTRKSHVGGL